MSLKCKTESEAKSALSEKTLDSRSKRSLPSDPHISNVNETYSKKL